MTISLTHSFVTTKPDSGDPDQVSADEWNAEHVLTQATGKLLGRTTAGTGATEEITPSARFLYSALGLDLATTISAAGPIGSATVAPIITFDAYGRLTTVTSATITPAASSITGGAALTKTDDTNVTLTLGGSPTTSLLAATSLTLGWTGTLALSRLAQGTDGQIIVGQTSASPLYKTLSGVLSLTAAGATALTTSAFANPSASIGLTANNGTATTAMRSDATPALSQSITPTWTAQNWSWRPSVTDPTSEIWFNRTGTVTGPFIQLQYGGSGHLFTPNNAGNGATSINFQNLSDTGASGDSITSLSIDAQVQAGTGGAAVAINTIATATGTWTPGVGGLPGASGINTSAISTKGGHIWGGNFAATANTTAATELYGAELDIQNDIAGTAQGSLLWMVSKNSVSPTAGSAILISSSTATALPTAGIYFSTAAGNFPLNSSADILKTDAGSVTNGITLNSLTISGSAFASSGFVVTGTGALTAIQVTGAQFVNAGLTGTYTGQMGFIGATSGAATLTVNAVAGTATLKLGTTSGTLAGSATSPLSINATTGVISLGTVAEANGGTNQTTYTTGDILYASAANTLSKRAAVATGSVFISQGIGTAPIWSTSLALSSTLTVNGATLPSGSFQFAVLGSSIGGASIQGATGAGNGGLISVGNATALHSFGTEQAILGGAATDNFLVYVPGAHDFVVYNNNVENLRVASGGVVSLTSTSASAVGTGTKTISNAADSSTNFGHYFAIKLGTTTYYIPCSTVAPT